MADINATGSAFNLHQFARREQRRADRLIRAAFGVGHTHTWFCVLTHAAQAAKVREWVEEAQQQAVERREGITAP